MYYLSAQPDDVFFKWQLEVQLLNFKKNGIPKERIHVLISYEARNGIHPKFIELAETQRDNACFFFYSDTRMERNYAPSLRPHIIKKHFAYFPFLQDECIFYHDCDIIFRELPDFERLCSDDKWYVSDTRSYLNASYIKGKGAVVFNEMCEVLIIERQLVLNNNQHAGGAQYILKGLTYQFWDKVENDSERLYKHLNMNKERYASIYSDNTGAEKSTYHEIQDWCADMWAVLWNGLALGFSIEIDKDLDFCWPVDPISRWEETKIFHNAGVSETDSDRFFCKTEFRNSAPYDVTFDHIIKDRCTIKYVEAIRYYMDTQRTDLRDVTFILSVRIESQQQLDNVYITANFINKHFVTKVLLLERGAASRVDGRKLPDCVGRIFIEDGELPLQKARCNNLMIRKVETEIISLYDADVVFDPAQIREAVRRVRCGADIVYPYDGKIISAWNLDMKNLFASKMDVRMFSNSPDITDRRAISGAVFIRKDTYVKCGMDNENITSEGVGDAERFKRMSILGFECIKVEGPIYHLSHRKSLHNHTGADQDHHTSMLEYIRICNMSKESLANEISNWEWSYSDCQ